MWQDWECPVPFPSRCHHLSSNRHSSHFPPEPTADPRCQFTGTNPMCGVQRRAAIRPPPPPSRRCHHKVILTGTPIQNQIGELFTLLNLLDPKVFASKDAFLRCYGQMTDSSTVKQLHKQLQPCPSRPPPPGSRAMGWTQGGPCTQAGGGPRGCASFQT